VEPPIISISLKKKKRGKSSTYFLPKEKKIVNGREVGRKKKRKECFPSNP